MNAQPPNQLTLKQFFWPENVSESTMKATSGLLGNFYTWRRQVVLFIGLICGLCIGALAIDNLLRLENHFVATLSFGMSVFCFLSSFIIWKAPDKASFAINLQVAIATLGFASATYGNSHLPFVFSVAALCVFYFLLEVRAAFSTSVVFLGVAGLSMYLSPREVDMAIVSRQVFEIAVVWPALHYLFCYNRWMSELYGDKLRARTKFVTTVNHEIRSPLNGIVGLLHITKDLVNQLPDDQKSRRIKENMDYMEDLHEHLASVVNNALLITQVKQGSLNAAHKVIKPCVFLHTAVEVFRKQCEEKDLTLNFNPSKQCQNHWIEIDPLRVRQLVFNLVSNAVKYTETGTILVTADIRDSEAGKQLYVAVKDTGLGIPKEKQYQVFEEFTQFHHQEEHLSKGTGLGLSLVKELVYALGGECGFNSAFGIGSLFWFSVPVTVATQAQCQQQLEEQSQNVSTSTTLLEESLAGINALVVDDESTNRKVIGQLLEKHGVQVTQAKNGLEALTAIREANEPFDIVFMDLQMPVMDGHTAIERIRQIEGYDDTPILCISGAMDEEGSTQAFTEQLQKPIKPEVLVAKTAYHCMISRIAPVQ